MTEARVECVRIGQVSKHPNADSLSITEVHGGYPVIFKTGDLNEGDLAVYVPVDSMVPTGHPAFTFLLDSKGSPFARIKAKKLRGTFSMGLLVAAPFGAYEGQDLQEHFGVEKYESPAERAINNAPNHEATRKSKYHELKPFERTVKTVVLAVGIMLTLAAIAGLPFYWSVGAILLTIASGYIAINQNVKRNRKPNIPVYDIEGLRRHKLAFKEGEEVWITEKIHGCNARYVHTGKKFFVGSRTMFRGNSNDVWHQVAKDHDLERKLAKHPGVVLFGEVYGKVQDLNYGVPAGEVRFMAFDAMNQTTREYMNPDEFQEFCCKLSIPVVPTLYRGPFNADEAVRMAEGLTMVGGISDSRRGSSHVREGIVIKPVVERKEHGLGRCFLKLAGQGYLLRKEA